MASPFPGMDPYLEAPNRWSGVHHRLLSVIAEMLGDALAPAFIVAVEERVYIATPGDLARMPWIQPDVFVVANTTSAPMPTRGMTITPPLLIEALEDEEVHEYYLEILDVETRDVVTTIEVLSPANKTAHTSGREKFLEKRRRVLASQTHWIEIDLLRAGDRPPELQGRGDYYVLLHNALEGAVYFVWAMTLRHRLPVIGVPTRAPFPDTPLDLQAVIDAAYRRGHYDIALAYDAPVPPPALSAGDVDWVIAQIAAWRLLQS